MIDSPIDAPDSYQSYRDLLRKYYAATGDLRKWRWATLTMLLIIAALTVAIVAVTR
jgi:hypothetical protein